MALSSNGTPRPLLKPDEVAQWLSISPRTLWRKVSKGEIPKPVRVGGSTRWRADVIESWLERGCPAHADDQE